MNPEELRKRTKEFALRIIKLVELLPKTGTANVIGNQLLRSGTSVGSNYRAACRAKSQADFISKVGIAVEEADESLYWLELIVESKMKIENSRPEIESLIKEADELVAIFSASIKSAKSKL